MVVDTVIIKDSSGRELYSLKSPGDHANFGRDPSKCEIKFEPTSKGVSRIHSQLEWNDFKIIYSDKSTYGSVIDGKKLANTSIEIKSKNTIIVVGESTFSIEIVQKETIESPSTSRCEIEDNSQQPVEDDLPMESCTIDLNRSQNLRKRKNREASPDDNVTTMTQRGRRGPFSAPAAKQTTLDRVFFKVPVVPARPLEEDEEMPVENNIPHPKDKEIEIKPELEPQFAIKPTISSASRANETIKYADLLFHGKTEDVKPDISVFSNVPNFKRFKPKFGPNSTTISFNNTTIRSNITIPLVAAQKMTTV